MPDMAQGLRTPLCRDLGIEYPIFSAGMGTGAGPDLAAAVSNAGGFGVVGASSFLADAMPALIGRIRERTTRPFGVNFIIDERDASDEDRAVTRQQVNAAITERVAAVVLFWGDPAPYVEEAHRHGVRIIIQVGSLDEAKAAAAAGVDAVIAQGVEAGGHVEGTTSIWTLLPAVVEAITPRPALASGGIGDGAGVARAIGLGAQGVSLGTRFVASDEFSAHPAYKQRIVEGTASDTVLNELYDVWWPNAPHRTLRNNTFAEWEAAGRPPAGQRPGEGTSIGKKRMGSGEVVEWPRYAIGVAPPDFDGDIEYAPLWAGESCSVVNDIKPAGDIVRDLARDADAILATAAGMPETESRPS
ncbi:MAG: nitronate monooxygenase [Chloroflexi bacterium]|nr:MAG: nitronate monooxygenase [Chloroflexota bacterium]